MRHTFGWFFNAFFIIFISFIAHFYGGSLASKYDKFMVIYQPQFLLLLLIFILSFSFLFCFSDLYICLFFADMLVRQDYESSLAMDWRGPTYIREEQ